MLSVICGLFQVAGVAPEFLAALPPEIQQEVLMQQQRTIGGSSGAPDAPADPDSFVRSLPDSLRRQVLVDMDDSQLGLLSPEFQLEARNLRRQVERQRFEAEQRQASSGAFRQHMFAMHDPAPYLAWGRHRHDALFDPLGFNPVCSTRTSTSACTRSVRVQYTRIRCIVIQYIWIYSYKYMDIQ